MSYRSITAWYCAASEATLVQVRASSSLMAPPKETIGSAPAVLQVRDPLVDGRVVDPVVAAPRGGARGTADDEGEGQCLAPDSVDMSAIEEEGERVMST